MVQSVGFLAGVAVVVMLVVAVVPVVVVAVVVGILWQETNDYIRGKGGHEHLNRLSSQYPGRTLRITLSAGFLQHRSVPSAFYCHMYRAPEGTI